MIEKASRGKKREITEEEIRGYIAQGFYFRVKEVNGKKYITRRKGREEKSLGRFNDEKWSMISALTEDQTDEDMGKKPIETAVEKLGKIKLSDSFSLLEQLKEEVSLSRGLIMSIECLHNIDDYCTYWHWESKHGFFETLDKLDGQGPSSYKLRDIVFEGRVVKRWTVKAQAVFCANCPAYISMRDIAFVEAYQFTEREKYKEIFKQLLDRE